MEAQKTHFYDKYKPVLDYGYIIICIYYKYVYLNPYFPTNLKNIAASTLVTTVVHQVWHIVGLINIAYQNSSNVFFKWFLWFVLYY